MSYMSNCPACGKNLALVGRAHNCNPVQPEDRLYVYLEEPVAFNGMTGEEIPLKKARGRPRKSAEGFNKAAWQRNYMRKKRA